MTASEQGGAWPEVSVVVATRHRPELLMRAVSSIIGQAYPGELECLVVFDQSEQVPPPAEIPAGRKLRVLTNTRKPGLAGARNTGITAAVGAVIAFCDDDDTWRPDKLTRQVELLNGSAAELRRMWRPDPLFGPRSGAATAGADRVRPVVRETG